MLFPPFDNERAKVRSMNCMLIIEKFNSVRYLIISVFIISGFAFPQENNETIAAAGSSVITVEEFRNRFEFMPHLNYSYDHPDSIKKEFLYSLIAEKLWALEAFEAGFDTLEHVRYSLKSLEKLFVKDKLYKREVESKIILTGDEIARGIDRVINLLRVNVIAAKDSAEAFEIYNRLTRDADFDSLLTVISKGEQIPLEITLGKLQNEYLEDLLYSMNIGEISAPVWTGRGWFIFKLRERINNPAVDPSTDYARNNAVKILRERKEQKFAGEFLDNLIAGKTIIADKDLFNIFTDNLISVLNEKIISSYTDPVPALQLSEFDLLKTLKKINHNDLTKTFIPLDEHNLTLKDFIYYLVYRKTEFANPDTFHIKSVINSAVKIFIEDEIISGEGYKRKLNELPSVINDLRIWRDYYLSLLFMEDQLKNISLSENDLDRYETEKKLSDSLLQINIIEILTDNIRYIEIILDEIQKGTDFEELAGKYNQREATKNSNGRWGLMPVSRAGEFGRIAEEMEIDDVYGPLKLPEGYSIFKLIDRRSVVITQADTLKENRDFLRVQLQLRKLNTILNNKTLELADKYGISINEELLNSLTLSELNTYTYRLIGFGGKIAAFPVTTPLFEWFMQFRKETAVP
jgi:parvulin-like peptidyl-prolyl isomerase